MTDFRQITDDLRIDMDKVISVEKSVEKTGSGYAPYNFILDVALLPDKKCDKIYHEEYVIAKCSHDKYKDPSFKKSYYELLENAFHKFY